MAQKTVKISAGYSDKVSENYNSQQFSINLEMDAHINGTTTEIEQASDRLFQLCRKIVSYQKGVSVDALMQPQPQQQQQPAPPQQQYQQQSYQTQQPSSPQQQTLCTEKQIRCIFGAGKDRGMAQQAIEALAQRFGKQQLEQLSSKEASILIKELKS